MKKKYLISGLIVMLIILCVYFIKHIFPFGHNYIAWGDLHSQVITLYYSFYDTIKNGSSAFLGLNSGIASNLIPNYAYYIVSPFTLIILLFKRVDIPQAVSLIVLFKFVLAAITCNYFLDKQFNKLNNFYKIFFSVIYALSTYNLSLYIITGWIDVVYLFPLLLSGLISLLKDKRPTMFIIVLSLSLIFNFYITFMCLLFIFFISLIYMWYYARDDIKSKITLLGFSVVLSLLVSSIILLPTITQILSSSRIGFNFASLASSKTGPILDKLMFLTSTMPLIVCNLFMLKKSKTDRKWISFLIISVILVSIPLIVEPINKMLHFGSYMYYPYRYGFILILLLIIGSCMYIRTNSDNKKYSIYYPNRFFLV